MVKNFIVKDFSRFGCNYAEAALYTEILFPKLDIRFIAVNDDVDSETQDSNEFLEIVRKYTALESLTPRIVNELIDRIDIHKPDKSTG
ncbi:DUF4368 domain-containing protein [Enterococcus canis]